MIPGSSRFVGTSVDADLAESLPATLELHTPAADAPDLDPATYEIVRHRMWSMADDMATVLKHMSGSPVVTEANDFNFVIGDEVGETVQIGQFNLMLGVSADLAVKWTMRHRSHDPGIDPGDMYFTNDPWVGGGLHQNDVSVMQPIFWEGKLFCWTTVVLHALDIGGIDAGGFTVSAKDVFAEPPPMPPIKYVKAGHIQPDVEDLLLRASRVPGFLALDLHGAYSSNLTARKQMETMLEAYGADAVKLAMRQMTSDAERRLRDRLRQVPDGTWSATQYMDSSGTGDRGVYAVRVKMSKVDDQLKFDFTESDPQTGMINCTASGARGGVAAGLLPMMAGDLPWALGGLMRCAEVITKPGTIVDATFPGAISKAPIAAGMTATNAAVETMSKMLDSSVEQRQHLLAGSAGTSPITNLIGSRADGTPFFGGLWEGPTVGIGARSHADGLGAGGWLCIPQGRVADVEAAELFTPTLYLWRRLEPDSGGPGAFRGGRAGSCCIVPHKVGGPIFFVISSSGKAIPQSPGLAGGYPGSEQRDIIYRGADLQAAFKRGEMPLSVEHLGGTADPIAVHALGAFNHDDALLWITQAGGGYLDPLLRDPERVAADVKSGAVTVESARDIYGVVVGDHWEADIDATEAVRDSIRAARAEAAGLDGESRATISLEPQDSAGQRLDENLELLANGSDSSHVSCRRCGNEVAGRLGELYDALATIEGAPGDAGPQIFPNPELFVDEKIVFRRFLCPSCLTLVTSEVVPEAHVDVAPSLELVEASESQSEAGV